MKPLARAALLRYSGGMTDAALARAVRCGDGWLPFGIDAGTIGPRAERLRELADEAGRACPEIVCMGSLPDSQDEAVTQLAAMRELGTTRYVQASRYEKTSEFDALVERLVDLRRQLA